MWLMRRTVQQVTRQNVMAPFASRYFAHAVELKQNVESELKSEDDVVPNVVAKAVEGTVRMFHVRKRFGFIVRADTNQDVFVHAEQILSPNPEHQFASLAEGEEVIFDIVDTPKGISAINVTGPAGSAVKGSSHTLTYNDLDFAPVLESSVYGKVVRFFEHRGFGFIKRDGVKKDESGELYFLRWSFKDPGQPRVDPQQGDSVVFDIVDLGRGRGPQAHRIRSSNFMRYVAGLDCAPVVESGVRGKVTIHRDYRGWGFITRDDGKDSNEDGRVGVCFLSLSIVKDAEDKPVILQEGDSVVFDLVDGGHEKGPQAHRVRKVDSEESCSVAKSSES